MVNNNMAREYQDRLIEYGKEIKAIFKSSLNGILDSRGRIGPNRATENTEFGKKKIWEPHWVDPFHRADGADPGNSDRDPGAEEQKNQAEEQEDQEPHDYLGKGTGANPAATSMQGKFESGMLPYRHEDLTLPADRTISNLRKWFTALQRNAQAVAEEDYPDKAHFMRLFQRVMEHNPNDTHWVPNGYPPILEWHFLFGGGLVKTSQDAARLLRRPEGGALYELNAIADIHRMLMEPGGALITTKGKATIKHILQDKACAAMT